MTTLHLCERCAAEKGVESPGSVAKTPLGSFLAAMGKERRARRRRAPRETCSRCGGSLQDFRESGRLGLPRVLASLRGAAAGICSGGCTAPPTTWASATPTGTAPPGEPARSRRPTCGSSFALAVETENFELAAELRDRLRVLE